VTGTSGAQKHLGNRPDRRRDSGVDEFDGSNTTDLRPLLTIANYLTPHSDLVALMVLEHQGEGHNRLTRANFLTRLALAEETEAKKEEGNRSSSAEWSESTRRRIDAACEPLVRYLLFSDEAALTDPVAGNSGFAKEFTARGPFDSKGRTLREFDLRTRMFRYPLSYLVYSRAFDGLPGAAKERVLRRIWEVLTEKDRSAAFAHLASADRRAIVEILRETKPNLPPYWHD
jgi:hypothetical protein